MLMTLRPLFLFVGLLAALSIFFGISQAARTISLGESDDMTALDSALCLVPCFLGITPGQTTFSQALEIISARVPQDQILGEGTFWIRGHENARVDITLRKTLPSNGSDLSSIELSTRERGEQIMSLGEILDMGYTPKRVFRNRVAGPNTINLLIVFDDIEQVVASIVATGEVTHDSPINTLFLLSPTWLLDDIRTIRNYDDEILWLGFASIEEYWAASER